MPPRWLASTSGRATAGLALLSLYALPFVLPALGSFFSPDDLMNLYYHRFQRSPAEAVTSTVAFWTTYRRPTGGILYLCLYGLFGLSDPLPYYLTGIALFLLNLSLAYLLILRLTRSVFVSGAGTAFASIHPELADVYYNFGAVYELLAYGFMLAAFHAYLALGSATPRTRGWWWTALVACYVLALGGKEMAVTLPAVLLLHALIYDRRRVGGAVRDLFPLFLIAAAATVGKTLGENAMGAMDPSYAYHLDRTMWRNLALYVEKIFPRMRVDGTDLLVGLAGAAAVAAVLRSRDMAFGLGMFLVTLTPVLGLPRNWGLFLYIPMVGLGLWLAGFLAVAGRVLSARLLGPNACRWSPRLSLAALVLSLGTFGAVHRPWMAELREASFRGPGEERRALLRQVFDRYPVLDETRAIALRTSPLPGFYLHHAVWMHYANPRIQVLAGPNFDADLLQELAATGHQVHALEYREGTVVEVPIEALR